MKLDKKGFTLVELIAVVVILIVIMLFAVNMVNKQMEKSRVNAFIKEANTFARGALQKESVDRNEDFAADDIFHNKIKGKVCYSVSQKILNKYVSKTKNNYSGSIEVCYGTDCEYQTKMWITDGKHFIDGLTSAKDSNDISSSFTSTEYPESCGIKAIGGGNAGTLYSADFDYTGEEQVMEILLDGKYSLEVWGAQGGSYAQFSGGYGGYSYGEVELHRGDKLYINVGEQGHEACTTNDSKCVGAYGGGAKPGLYAAGGGGGTSIARKSGLLNKPVTSDNVLVAAGGGGGGYFSARGKHAGGRCTEAWDNISNSACSNGSSFVYGGFTKTQDGYFGNGGGYGAANVGRSFESKDVTWGGLGYTGKVENGVMYSSASYGTNNASNLYTENVEETPTEMTSKAGNGYARIKYLANDEVVTQGVLATDFSDYLRLEYIASTGTQYIDTKVKMSPSTGIDLDLSWIANGYAFGASSTNSLINMSTCLYYVDTSWANRFWYAFNDGAPSNYSTGVAQNGIQNVKLNITPKRIEIRGSGDTYTYDQTSLPTQTSSSNLYLFANNNYGQANNYSQIKVYGLKIYEDGDLIRNFIPCYSKVTLDIGLCDLVTKEFYTNKGTGNFRKGPVNNS